MFTFKKIFPYWLYTAIIIGLIALFSFVTAEKSIRISSDTELVQIAKNGVPILEQGTPPASVISPEKKDMAKIETPFIMIFSKDKKLEASTVQLNNADPKFPSDILTKADSKDVVKSTWRPSTDLKIATVVIKYKGTGTGYIVIGRNLNSIQGDVNEVGVTIVTTCIITLIVNLLVALALCVKPKKKNTTSTEVSDSKIQDAVEVKDIEVESAEEVGSAVTEDTVSTSKTASSGASLVHYSTGVSEGYSVTEGVSYGVSVEESGLMPKECPNTEPTEEEVEEKKDIDNTIKETE